MLKDKDSDWETVPNPDSNYREFATIRSQAGLKGDLRHLEPPKDRGT